MKECKHGRGDCPGIRNCSGSFQDCEEPQPVTVFQGAEEFAKKLSRNGIIECGHEDCKACPEHLKEWIKDIESRDAAQRQAGREEAFRYYSIVSTYPNLPDDDERKKAFFCGVAEAVQRYAALVEAADKARYFVETYAAKNPKWINKGREQDPNGAHKLLEELNKALRELDEGRKG